MCGINAIYRLDGRPTEIADIVRMSSAIQHRGPDGAGFARLAGGSLLLGNVRLSIIDLASGQQPLYNEDGSVCVVFNGEIYDYQRLREELLAEGHRFRTASDTEVIVHLYEQHGLNFLDRLNGEFAFVIWDANRGRLLAARDRFGVKPLLYHREGNELLISSEAKGIFALERVKREISPDYLLGPLVGAFPPAGSVFTGIHSLKPGHILKIEDGRVGEELPYWQPSFNVDSKMSFEDARDGVRRIFTQAVRRRMVADVPVGTYLSGGLDSTLVCGLMSQMARETGAKLKAFNIGFGNSVYDESPMARRIAEHYGAEFETTNCTNEQLAENFTKTLSHVETPLANPNSVAKTLLSELVRSQGYKVCITGEGADEVFGGYPYFKLEVLWRMMLAGGGQAAEAKRLFDRFQAMERRSEGLLWDRGNRWKSMAPVVGYPSFVQLRIANSMRNLGLSFQKGVIERASQKSPQVLFEREFGGDRLRALHPFNATKLMTFNQLTSYIIPTLGDRVEMANSVECRTPFLDRDLIEFAGTVPPEHFMKIEELREKHLLREAFRDLVPPFTAKEHKHPFLAPNWKSFSATRRGREIFRHYLSGSALRKSGFFNPGFVTLLKAYASLLSGESVVRKKADVMLGLILSTQAIQEIFVDTAPRAPGHFEMREMPPPSRDTRTA